MDLADIRKAITYSLYIKKRIQFYFEKSDIDNYDFEEIEKCLYTLNKNGINVYKWLITLAKFSFKPYSDEWDCLSGFILGLNKAYIYHFKNLLYEFDRNFNLEDGLFNIFSELVDEFIHYDDDDFFRGDYFTTSNKMIKETDIIFPQFFLTWNIDDLIESIYAYITDDTIYDVDNWLKKDKSILINQKDLIPKVNKILEIYYFDRTRNRLQEYEKELIEETWKPSRLINWCLDEEDKNDLLANEE